MVCSAGARCWIGDAVLTGRTRTGTLMLAVQARSFSNYFCLASSNASLPPRFLDSKVPGVLSENRVDYASKPPIPDLTSPPPEQPADNTQRPPPPNPT